MDRINQSQPSFRADQRTPVDRRASLATRAPAQPQSEPAGSRDESDRLRADLERVRSETENVLRAGEAAGVASGALAAIGALLAEAGVRAEANLDAGLDADERASNQLEIDQAIDTIEALAAGTTYDGSPLLDGGVTLQAGGESFVIERANVSDLGLVEREGRTLSIADIRSGGELETASGDAPRAIESLGLAREQVAWARTAVRAFASRAVADRAGELAISMANIAAAGGAPPDLPSAREWASGLRAGLMASGAAPAAGDGPGVRAGLLRLLF